ncbi:MAG: DUF4352 domain-containing protein [Chloroflexota bacterium]
MQRNQSALLIIVGGGIAILCLMMGGLWYIVRDAEQRFGDIDLAQADVASTPEGQDTGSSETVNQAPSSVQSKGGQTPDGLQIEALVVYEDAWPLMRAVNQFNDPPLEGRRMLMIKLRISNPEGIQDPLPSVDESDFELVGAQNEVYTTFGDNTSCGVVTSAISGIIAPNDWISGNVCFQIPDRPQPLVLTYKPFIGDDEPLLEIDLAQVERMARYAVE